MKDQTKTIVIAVVISVVVSNLVSFALLKVQDKSLQSEASLKLDNTQISTLFANIENFTTQFNEIKSKSQQSKFDSLNIEFDEWAQNLVTSGLTVSLGITQPTIRANSTNSLEDPGDVSVCEVYNSNYFSYRTAMEYWEDAWATSGGTSKFAAFMMGYNRRMMMLSQAAYIACRALLH